MKKLIISLFSLGMAGMLLSGCVNDNQYVVLKGLVPGPLSECDATSESQTYQYAVGPCIWSADASMLLSAQVMNFITGEVPWSSAGSGSGTTFEGEIVNPGIVYLDNIMIECKSVDGEPDGCDGVDPVTISANFPIKGGGGGICLNFDLNQIMDFSQWDGQVVVLEIYGNYHDPSRVSGTTSHVDFTAYLNGKIPSEVEGDKKLEDAYKKRLQCRTFVDENEKEQEEEEPTEEPEDPNAGKDDGSGGSDGSGDSDGSGGSDDGMEIYGP